MEQIDFSTLPLNIRLLKFVIEANRRVPASPAENDIKSLICCGRRPSRPGADPCEKEAIPCLTSFEETTKQQMSSDGASGIFVSLEGAGCFLRSS